MHTQTKKTDLIICPNSIYYIILLALNIGISVCNTLRTAIAIARDVEYSRPFILLQCRQGPEIREKRAHEKHVFYSRFYCTGSRFYSRFYCANRLKIYTYELQLTKNTLTSEYK